ncbi:MAG: sulfatase [Candidatus Poribacteria bacterium]|nr:MAG: sulfatase [Candidatus Poribacteria bacterium]
MNVVVICCDTLRADVVHHTHPEQVETPHLDRLRAQSSIFTNAWAEGLPTIPMRRCFYTGVRSYPWRYHVDDRGSFPNMYGWHAIPTGHTTVAERLVPQGVMTGLIADVYHMFKPTMNFTRGFLSWRFIRGQESDPYRTGPLSKIDLRRVLPDELATPEKRPGMAQYLLNVLDRQREEDYFAAQVFRTAAQWLEENRENRPFLLWIESFTPHEHWDPPPYYADRYFSKPGVRDFIYPQMVQNFRPLTEDEVRRTKALYYGYVTFLDRWIGYFLDALEASGLWDETAILLLSDHGTELMDHDRFGKSGAALHPYNTQILCWLRHPDASLNGKEISAFVQATDVAPTILSLFGVSHEPLDGYDLLPLLRGEVSAYRDHVVIGWGGNASIRDERWNLILDTIGPEAKPRLYDHQSDPAERENLAERHPDVVETLRRRLEQLLGGPIPTRYTHRPQSQYPLRLGHWLESNLSR